MSATSGARRSGRGTQYRDDASAAPADPPPHITHGPSRSSQSSTRDEQLAPAREWWRGRAQEDTLKGRTRKTKPLEAATAQHVHPLRTYPSTRGSAQARAMPRLVNYSFANSDLKSNLWLYLLEWDRSGRVRNARDTRSGKPRLLSTSTRGSPSAHGAHRIRNVFDAVVSTPDAAPCAAAGFADAALVPPAPPSSAPRVVIRAHKIVRE